MFYFLAIFFQGSGFYLAYNIFQLCNKQSMLHEGFSHTDNRNVNWSYAILLKFF